MVNPFELIEKFPPKRTWKDKLGSAVFIAIVVGILGLAAYGTYCLIA